MNTMKMKNSSTDAQFVQLSRRLSDALQKERNFWKPRVYKHNFDKGGYISPVLRDEMVHWLSQLTDKYNFHPETFSLSVAIFDHFLSIIKVSTKYIRCITSACFYLAAKLQEEDEVIPSTLDFVLESQCGCSVSDLLRMERIILDKFGWNLSEVTPLDFLHIFHSLLLLSHPQLLTVYSHMTPGHQLTALTTKLKLCLLHHQLMEIRPSVLALSLISLELEWYTTDWLPPTAMLQTLIMVECQQVVRGRELISSCLFHGRHKTIVHRFTPEAINKRAKRKVSESDDDGVYDGIKRLYNEDDAEETPSPHHVPRTRTMSCASEVANHDRPGFQIVEAT